jgi:hypothetical protein
MSDTLTLDEIRNLPEDVPEHIESADYSPYDLVPIGYYLSRQREIVPRKSQRTGNLYYEVRFTSGLENPDTARAYGRGKYPEKMFLFGNLRTREGKRGQTSDVAEYLRAAGIDPKGITSVADALQESTSRDVMAFVSWTNKTEQVSDSNGGMTWTKEVLRGKDFNTGTVSDPVYVPTIEVEGVRYDARHKVVGFRRVQ